MTTPLKTPVKWIGSFIPDTEPKKAVAFDAFMELQAKALSEATDYKIVWRRQDDMDCSQCPGPQLGWFEVS